MSDKIKMVIELKLESEEEAVQELQSNGHSLEQINNAINMEYDYHLKNTADYLKCDIDDIIEFKIKCIKSK